MSDQQQPADAVRIGEVLPGETHLAAAALLTLNTRWQTVEALTEAVDECLRPQGYRVVAVFRPDDEQAVAAAGFRQLDALARGRYLEVCDMSTLPQERGVGHGERLMLWLIEEARRLGCGELHLDSAVGADRAAAHRLYMRHKLRISAHHFHVDL